MGQADVVAILAGRVGRFYGDGLRWALSLPIHELIEWNRLIGEIGRVERGG